MRPALLDPLFAPVSSLPGIGPKLAAVLARVLPARADGSPPHVASLLLTPPRRVIDRRVRKALAEVSDGMEATLTLRVESQQWAPEHKSRLPHRIIASDGTAADITLTFFQMKRAWLEKAYPLGETVTIFGTVESWNHRLSMVHPEKLSGSAEAGTLRLVEPVYPMTEGLTPRTMRNAVSAALSRLPALPEWQRPERLAADGLAPFGDALRTLHDPEEPPDIAPESPARRRLALDELLAQQLALALTRRRMVRGAGLALAGDGRIRARLRAALPFALTTAQDRSLAEIDADMARPERMLRLLQGDVGSGKTVVALMAMAQAAEAGFQSAMMAPTELLARQHAAGLAPLAGAAGLNLALLTGRMKAAERAGVLDGLAEGRIHIVVGTHALFQEAVAFRRLGLVVVDEQHRFGVHQRLALSAKGETPDLLVMTATPIPRTLVLAMYGDMETSRLDEKPAGRKPITTVATPFERIDDLAARIDAAIGGGAKVYWIVPLVEDSALVEQAMSAEARHAWAMDRFRGRAGLIHGRMDSEAKDAAMAAFRSGERPLLIATTVIEVGVDVPDATIIVIENAERFGLAQLHQLRGRVGRGSAASTCVLLYRGPLGATARARLDIMRQTEDGFLIAEEDLRLRGEGDLLGVKQSGEALFRLAELPAHGAQLQAARDEAKLIVTAGVDARRAEALRVLLHLFGKDEAVRLLAAG